MSIHLVECIVTCVVALGIIIPLIFLGKKEIGFWTIVGSFAVGILVSLCIEAVFDSNAMRGETIAKYELLPESVNELIDNSGGRLQAPYVCYMDEDDHIVSVNVVNVLVVDVDTVEPYIGKVRMSCGIFTKTAYVMFY